MQVHRGRSRAIRFYNGGNGPSDWFSRLQSLVKHFFTSRDALRNWILDQNNQILSVLSTKQARKNLASGLEALWDMVGRSLGLLEGLPTLNKNETCCFLGVKCFWSSFLAFQAAEETELWLSRELETKLLRSVETVFRGKRTVFCPNNNYSFFSEGPEKILTLKGRKNRHGWMHRDIRKNPYFRVTKR